MTQMDDERSRILQMIEDGQISAAEGLRRIKALRPSAPPDTDYRAGADSEAADDGVSSLPPDLTAEVGEKPAPPRWAHWQNWWLIPVWIGIAITLAGALLMYWAFTVKYSFSGWFWLALLLVFVPGVAIMALAATSRNIKWLHIRIKNDRNRERLKLSFPIPVTPAAWLLRTFGHRLPVLKETGVDELIMALGETTSPDNPLYVEVDDDEEGERVQVYIG